LFAGELCPLDARAAPAWRLRSVRGARRVT
jgi:hypothetical protein